MGNQIMFNIKIKSRLAPIEYRCTSTLYQETKKQFAAAQENRTQRDSDVTRKRNQAAGVAAIW